MTNDVTQPATPPEHAGKETAPETPKMIEKGDPEGRQPGDPNAPIELPAAAVAPAAPTNMVSFDSAEDLDRFIEALAKKDAPAVKQPTINDVPPPPTVTFAAPPVAEPAPVVEQAAAPVLTDQTLEELRAGRAAVMQSTVCEAEMIVNGDRDEPFRAAPETATSAFSRANYAENRPSVPTVHPRTLAEQEAGRAAVQRKAGEVERGRAIMRAHNADRLKEGAPADAGDLSYVPQR